MIKNNIYINEPICNEENRDQIKPISTSTLISNKKQQQFSKCAKIATNNKMSTRRNVKQPQSIRLQIEVPIQMSNMSEDEESGDDMKDNVSIMNNLNENELTFVTENYEPPLNDHQSSTKTKKTSINTIRFQISFDSSSNVITSPRISTINTNRKQSSFGNVQAKKNDSSRASSLTSGYFSSTSDYNDTDTDTDTVHNRHSRQNPNLSLNLENINNSCQKRRNSINAFQDTNSNSKILRCSNRYTANLYDKLDHATTKRRYSLSSDSTATGPSSLSSSSSSLASVVVAQQLSNANSFNDTENIYEDISNFCAKDIHDRSPTKHEMYGKLAEFASENKQMDVSVNTTSRTTRSSFKREYTVNEIFQNLKSFKEQATHMEKLYEHPNVFAKSTDEPRSQKKSVAALKQMFESSSTSCISSNASILKRIQKVKQLRHFKNENQCNKAASPVVARVEELVPHTYVNERISTPVNV